MKVHLVVAQGVHTGKMIPITTPEFLIGRDAHCNLRPASPSVSKQHCGIFMRDNKVVLEDYGSTNGTCVNGEKVVGELEIANDDQLKIGPLEFLIRIEAGDPATTIVGKPPAKKNPAIAAKGPTAKKVVEPVPTPPTMSDSDSEDAAAMLMAMEDDTPSPAGSIPDGATSMDIPAMPGETEAKPPPPPPKPSDTSKAAADILSKYMRRPRT